MDRIRNICQTFNPRKVNFCGIHQSIQMPHYEPRVYVSRLSSHKIKFHDGVHSSGATSAAFKCSLEFNVNLRHFNRSTYRRPSCERGAIERIKSTVTREPYIPVHSSSGIFTFHTRFKCRLFYIGAHQHRGSFTGCVETRLLTRCRSRQIEKPMSRFSDGAYTKASFRHLFMKFSRRKYIVGETYEWLRYFWRAGRFFERVDSRMNEQIRWNWMRYSPCFASADCNAVLPKADLFNDLMHTNYCIKPSIIYYALLITSSELSKKFCINSSISFPRWIFKLYHCIEISPCQQQINYSVLYLTDSLITPRMRLCATITQGIFIRYVQLYTNRENARPHISYKGSCTNVIIAVFIQIVPGNYYYPTLTRRGHRGYHAASRSNALVAPHTA